MARQLAPREEGGRQIVPMSTLALADDSQSAGDIVRELGKSAGRPEAKEAPGPSCSGEVQQEPLELPAAPQREAVCLGQRASPAGT